MAREFRRGAKIERWERNLRRPVAALKQIGVIMVAESVEAFDRQGLGDEKWEPRAPINVYGILADFAAGKKAPPARRFQRTPVLRDTGRLASSIDYQVLNNMTVEVGSSLDYASVHQYGGDIESVPITAAVRIALWAWLRGAGREYKAELGWLLNKKFIDQTLKGEVPARPFVGITKQTIEDVAVVVGVKLFEAK